MGIYDQLNQLDKNSHPPTPQPVANKSLNPEPDQATAITSAKPAVPKPESKKANLPENKITSLPESKKASKRASQKTRKPESQTARKPVNKKASLPESQPEQWLVDLQVYLDLRASHKVSFRYPDDLIAWLEESLYKLKKAYGKKITKNALLVAALTYALWDLEQQGQKSFLYQQLIQERE